MPHLRLDQVKVRRAVERVGADDREHVRKAWDADALIGLVAIDRPPLPEIDTADAADRIRDAAGLEHLEAGRQHEHVDIVLGAVDGADAARDDRLDRRRLEHDVVAVNVAR